MVRLPTTEEDVLAAAFARVPWEIARLGDGTRVHNLVVRALTEDTARGEASATGEALALARTDVAEEREQSAYHAVDHATPLMFGQPGVLLEPQRTRSRQMERLRPRPQPLLTGGRRELDPPPVFVGRGEPLTRLGGEWLGQSPARDGPGVALVQGLAGLGKTVLAAEAIHLWHNADLFPEPEDRYRRMRANLIEVLRDEAILLVIDNFENNLEGVEREAGSAVYACADPAWDALLAELVRELPATRSRLLVTSRHRPRALAQTLDASTATLWIPLGPLPMGEAGLFVRSHPALRRLVFSETESERKLVQRLLKISRGHPLILDRFARLAGDPAALDAALDRVQAQGWQQLPDLFAGSATDDVQREAERKYLEDVAIGSVDLLIERLTPDARRLLRLITLANEPVNENFIDGVWQGKTFEDEQLDQIGMAAKMLDLLPDDDPQKQQLAAAFETEEGKQLLEQLRNRPERPEVPPVGPLLSELHGTGLLTKEEPPEGQATYGFHELVRERMVHWRKQHKDDTDGRTDEETRIAYGERYAHLFDALYHKHRNAAGEAGRRALVYFVAARAFDRLGSFASRMITGVNDPALLRSLVAELEGAIDQAPPGKPRWSLRTYVADALRISGQPDRALPFYSEAAAEAEAAKHWSDVGWIAGNWANAAGDVGDLEESKRLHLRSAEAERQAGNPEVNAVGSEVEALRIDVMRGEAQTALPEIESRLERVRDWWRRSRAGASVAEAPNRTFLGRALVSGLDIARQANQTLKRWQACLDLLQEQETARRALSENEVDLAKTRFSRYGSLMALGRLDEAQRVLEDCLDVYRSAGAVAQEARCLSALASLWGARGEIGDAIALERQALAVRNRLPDPSDRAISHGNLGNYHEKAGQHTESAMHVLAAGVYFHVTDHRDKLATWLRNLGIRARRALTAGERYALPALEAILAQGEFAALRQFLDSHDVDRVALQAELDSLVEQAHGEASGASDSALGDMPPELVQLLGPILAAAAAGEDVEPLLTGLREQLAKMGANEDQIDGLLELIRGGLKSPE